MKRLELESLSADREAVKSMLAALSEKDLIVRLFLEGLFANASANEVYFQLRLCYEFAINGDIGKIRLPVYRMPPG